MKEFYKYILPASKRESIGSIEYIEDKCIIRWFDYEGDNKVLDKMPKIKDGYKITLHTGISL